ncbi:TlpA disulfide reductase family protein [Myxococcus sp. MISCRS1]|uniref:TlpA disulfide reductase family protein n=1 Tax=Myxococcus TaxID=32 RepID=UPI001142CD79|nr:MULTISPECIES: TlpA disulfide reductase family protein [unclassified Myxococcus]MBZ4400588.1 TlpA family protein disulfide reductase [Myxococcus sp. AS-1-15]MBZ4412838.1 TlpA family protein disulfide reductase [Myxococcus sp. XM-1-1-1]MCY0997332.1 TlpA disulfide reductase family protein [Myxococcus sp. MISCRS1]BDT32652.1 TlpA family protein disulfide reductase [Myxococcus sp. MH1]
MRLCLPVVLGALSLAGCARAPSMPPLTQPAPSGVDAKGAEDRNAPLVFQVKRYPGGEPYDLASDKGSVVLLDVWATWCEPCKDALPFYENLQREYANKGLKVYALNIDEDSRAIPAFLKEVKVGLPILLDENAQVAERTLKVRGMPTTYFIDRRGVVRHVHEGFNEEFLTKYQSELEALLAEPAP